MLTDRVVNRFSRGVRPAEHGCWLWVKGRTGKGYGVLSVCGKQYSAHRVSYMIFKGEIADGLEVCHSCDVPACVNPAHLHLGTHAQNMSEAAERGRMFRGRRGKDVEWLQERLRKAHARIADSDTAAPSSEAAVRTAKGAPDTDARL